MQQVVTAALPILLSGMQQNARTEEGAQSLAAALDNHAADSKKSTKTQLQNADAKDGKKIVKHVLGDNTFGITKGLAKKSGLTSAQVTMILAVLAPVLLSALGGHKNETNTDSSGLSGMLGSLLFGSSSANTGSGLDVGSIASALLGGGTSSSSSSHTTHTTHTTHHKQDEEESTSSDLTGALLGSLLGGGKTESSGSSATTQLAGSLLGSLLGGSSESSSGKKHEEEEESSGGADLLSGLLGLLK